MNATAIVLAAGRGRRMGQDKALLDLGGRSAIERVVAACRAGGCRDVLVVRVEGDAALPAAVSTAVTVVELATPGEMLDSLRLGLQRLPGDADAVLVFPVDYALVDGAVVRAVLDALEGHTGAVALPLWEERPGHPIALASQIVPEVFDSQTASLRDVVVRDASRVRAVPVGNAWVRRDLDTPADLEAARAWLRDSGTSPTREE